MKLQQFIIVLTLVCVFGITLTTFVILIYKSNTIGEKQNVQQLVSFNAIGVGQGIPVNHEPVLLNFQNILYGTEEHYISDNGTIWFKNEGVYSITYDVHFQTTIAKGGDMATFHTYLTMNNEKIEGSQSSCFLKKYSNAFLSAGCHKTIIRRNITDISLFCLRKTGSTNCEIQPTESSITIVQIQP